MKDKKAVFLGRFQPFHLGHHSTVHEFREKYELEIVVGSSRKSGTGRNPLSFKQRKQIIENCFPELDITPLPDEDRGEEGYKDWTERLVEVADPDIVVTRNDLVQRLVKKYTDAEIKEQELYRPHKVSGTRIRKLVREKDPEWRELVPDCTEEKMEKYLDIIGESGE